jgi:hypothetical protein
LAFAALAASLSAYAQDATITGGVTFDGAPAAVRVTYGGSDEVACAVDAGRFRCVVPASAKDLRFYADGHVAEFRWDVALSSTAANDLGTVAFRSGAALYGFVTLRRGIAAEMKDVRVTASRQAGSDVFTATPNARGFFKIAALPPGDYLVSATGKRIRSELRPARVVASRNAELRDPLVLDRPKRIAVRLVPPLDADGHNWRVHLQSVHGRRLEDLGGGVADRDGVWSREAIAGDYDVDITRADGALWNTRRVTLSDEDITLDLSLAAARLHGRVKLGDDPLAAHVELVSSACTQQTFISGDDGRYGGDLPAGGGDATWDITVTSAAPPIERKLKHRSLEKTAAGELRFDVTLPRTALTGRVVDDKGVPQPHAIVELQPGDVTAEDIRYVVSGDDGAFELIGSEAGKYRISAKAFMKASEIVAVTVDDNTPPVEIVLRPQTRIAGRVMSGPMPLAGVEVSALPRDRAAIYVPSATTDDHGAFTIGLPLGTHVYDAVVVAPGFPFTMARAAVRDDGKIVEIGIDRQGGELIAEVPKGSIGRLTHLGAEVTMGFFEATSGVAIESREASVRTRIAAVDQGEYTLCANDRCTSGSVAPNGTLTLTIR